MGPMMLRPLLALLLIVVLALTGQTMAQARGAAAATGQMVICTGTGPMVVYVDAEGQPTEAPQICPEATMQLPTAGGLTLAAAPQRLLWSAPVASLAPRAAQPARLTLPPVRAPPLPV